jgi:hypothetical protein
VKFCTECGKEITATVGAAQPVMASAAVSETASTIQTRQAPPPQPAYQPPPSSGYDFPPPKGSKYAPIGTGGYIGMMILFAIPVIGWLACIITAFASGNRNRRNYARAALVFLIIGIVISVALYFLFGWAWDAAREYIKQYVGEATGGQITDFDGLGGLFDLFKGIDIPALTGQ